MRVVAVILLVAALAGCTTKRQAKIGIGAGLGIAVGSLALGNYVGRDNHQEPGADFAIIIGGGYGGLGIALLSLIDLGFLVVAGHVPAGQTMTPGAPVNEIGAEGSSCSESLEHCAFGLACLQGVCTRTPD